MSGRKPQLNWTKSRGQYTTTVNGKFHLLGPDRQEAEKHFRWLEHKYDLGEQADTNPPFAEVADAWLNFVEENHDPERYRLCSARMQEFIEFVGERLRVKEIRARHVSEWMAQKLHVKKPGTERQYKAIILASLNWAASKRVRMISINPLKGMIDLPEGGSRGGEVVWPEATLKTVLRVANPAFADAVRILSWTGARPSTICQVEKKHFVAHLNLWDVEALYQNRRNKKKYVRRIWLPKQAVELVERLNLIQPSGPIFRNSKGTPWSPDTLGVYLYQLRHKFLDTRGLDWPDAMCMYGLRHTFATRFIKEHPDKLEYLRELLGHRNMDMIRKHYGHLFDEHHAIHEVLGTLQLPG
ncbi:MAG: tyrosine-type recombinase/integrase [Gemmataceae bacterium]|nr:tyrosine-type recombinase/integrase [Gemmataceae bacterium]